MTQKNSCSGCSSALSSPPPWSQKVATERDIDSGIITVDLIAQLPSMVRHVKSGRQWTFFLKINQTLGCFLRQKSHEVGSSCLCTIFLANRMSRIPPPNNDWPSPSVRIRAALTLGSCPPCCPPRFRIPTDLDFSTPRLASVSWHRKVIAGRCWDEIVPL